MSHRKNFYKKDISVHKTSRAISRGTWWKTKARSSS